MSFRDLRNLVEILRTIGYPRIVSVENFRTPNFLLVADIARWLVHQYDPKVVIPSSTDSEADRVTIVRVFTEFMLTKVQVKLNTKRLYQADGYAVKELIKVAAVIYNAVRAEALDDFNSNGYFKDGPVDYIKIDQKALKETRDKATRLVTAGASLYDMLNKEIGLRESRIAALSKAYEYAEVERLIKAAIEAGTSEAKKMVTVIENVQNNLSSIENKIEKKQSELERSQKRLLTLKKVRPAFMDEYEDMQIELAVVYQRYVDRFRSLSYLQNKIEEKNRIEMDRKAEERLSKADYDHGYGTVPRKLSSTENYIFGPKGNDARPFPLSSGSDEDSSDDLDAPLTGVPPPVNNSAPPRQVGPNIIHKTRVISGAAARARIYGSMMGGQDDSDDDESDMILVDGDDNSDLGTDDDDEELVKMQKTLASESSLTNGGTLSKMGKLENDRPAMNGLRNGQNH